MKHVKKGIGFFLIFTMIIGLILPQSKVQAASSTVKFTISGKTATYKKKKTYLMINNQKKGVSKTPIFIKEGCYMGSALEIFKNSDLGVTYKESSNHKTLTLSYKGHTIKMTSGSKKIVYDGESDSFATAPVYGTYTSGSYKRWIVPLNSVCARLGLNYKKTSSSVIRISNKIILVIDAGHGGKDSGAIGNGKYEKNMTLAIVKAAKAYFDKDSRFEVHYTRVSDTYPTLDGRCELANEVNADLFISCHINSAGSTARGTETLYNKDRNSKTKKGGITSYQLASMMQTYALKATGFTNRGLVNRTGLRVLRKTNMPAVIIEYGFISNKTECAKMNANLSRYGKYIYKGVVKLMKNKGKIS